ncbi:MAG: excinuclease ABC subunit UvrC [Acidobacteriota bacterium]
MAIHDLKAQISRLPNQPGVYLFANPAGETIYIGKARSLRDRVKTYLSAYGSSPRTDALLDEVTSLDVIMTDSVVEALALENNLIKQRVPKFNILLRDDKNYPYLQLTTSEAFPRLVVARQVETGPDFFAGPFLPATLARRTMALTHRVFGIRSCNEVITGARPRPCLEYDIGRCLAPCVSALCSPERYAEAVVDTRWFLEGRNEELARQLRQRMELAALGERYEEAAQLRDAIRTVEAVQLRQQKMATAGLNDRDVIGVAAGPGGVLVQVFVFRGGRVVERFELLGAAPSAADTSRERAAPGAPVEAEVVGAALAQLYANALPPPVIHVGTLPPDHDLLEAGLSARAGRRVRIRVPRRGDTRAMLELVRRNASLAYRTRFEHATLAPLEALERLQDGLALPALPRRIECFDISTIQGSETVGSLVVCEDGRMKREEYRKYRVQPESEQPRAGRFLDDFAAMRQVVRRRYARVLDAGGPFPDLIVIDGGKGQLSAAYEGLSAVGLSNLVAVGLAKKEELVFTKDRDHPLAFDPSGSALRLLQRIRDEAHRFAVTFHRRARAMRDLRSELDAVRGIGARRRKALLTTFGSLTGVKRASREELTRVVGAKAAGAIVAHFAEAGS